jgi:hypothetical protein
MCLIFYGIFKGCFVGDLVGISYCFVDVWDFGLGNWIFGRGCLVFLGGLGVGYFGVFVCILSIRFWLYFL